MARSYTYHGVTVSRKLSADEQRSLAMRLRNFGVKYRVGIAESVAPVEVTSPPKLTVVYERPSAPRKTTTRKAVKSTAKTTTKKPKANAWEQVKADWDATREAGTYTCECGKVFASLGSPEKGGALFHKDWTKAKGIYGKGEDHFIPTIR
jgi:hypothetical protein